MFHRKKILAVCALQFIFLPNFAQAQSSDFENAFNRQGAEARVSLTIPLGRSENKTKTSPRLNLGFRNYEQESHLGTDWVYADKQNYRDMSLGFTLESKPKLMMNEQVLILPEDDQANIGTAGKIGLGALAIVTVGVAAIFVAFASCDDNDGGCFGEK